MTSAFVQGPAESIAATGTAGDIALVLEPAAVAAVLQGGVQPGKLDALAAIILTAKATSLKRHFSAIAAPSGPKIVAVVI